MNANDLARAIETGTAPTILDVRTRAEYDAGHIPGAINIPFTALPVRAGEIPGSHDTVFVVYCGHGPRAWIARQALRARGFTRVELLDGHWSKWIAAGRPVATS